MNYIDLHAHMTSRTTDDYQNLGLSGCIAVSEPAFWAGYDRASETVFQDYFEHLTTFEPKRAAKYGIAHYTFLSVNPKEADNLDLSDKVLPLIRRYLDRGNVLGIGETGVNRITRNELITLDKHIKMAIELDQLIQIHTPHLEDKLKGTKAIIQTLRKNPQIKKEKVLVDHVEEHTIEMVLQEGFWAGITLYPQTKVSPERAVDIIEMYGSVKICVASACDWGPSVPIAIPHFVLELKKRGHSKDLIQQIVYSNPATFLGQSPKFKLA